MCGTKKPLADGEAPEEEYEVNDRVDNIVAKKQYWLRFFTTKTTRKTCPNAMFWFEVLSWDTK